MFLHLSPPFFLKYWYSPLPHVLFYFVCFCHLAISPLVNNQAFLPIPTISISVLTPVDSLLSLYVPFYPPFLISSCFLFSALSSHSSYLFSSCMFSMPIALLRRPWKRLARVRDGLLPGKAKDYKKGKCDRKEGNKTGRTVENWKHGIGSLQHGSRFSPLLWNTVARPSSTSARSTLCQWEREARLIKVAWKRDREI